MATRVLVTGGLGVNGVWVVRRLLAEGHTPVVLDERPDFSLIPDLQGQFEVCVGSILDFPRLVEVLRSRQIEVVAHLAALMPDACQADPYRGMLVNAQGTATVLEAARLCDVPRVVFTSSKAVYGPFTGEYGPDQYRPVDEDFPRSPLPAMRVYGAAKVMSEDVGLRFSEVYGVEFLALRFATIYGPGKQARHGRIAIHGTMIENAMAGRPTEIPTGGDERDDMLYVKDVAQAIVRACLCTKPAHWVFNIGTGRGSTLHHLAHAVRRQFPAAEITIGPGLDYMRFGRVYGVFDIRRAQAELGYAPEFDLDAGVADYIRTLA